MIVAVATYGSCWNNGLIGPDPRYVSSFEVGQVRGEGDPAGDLGEFSQDIGQLPLDPQSLMSAIYRRMRRDEGGPVLESFGNGRVSLSISQGLRPAVPGQLRAISELLANPLASPELRSALYKLAAGINGVETIPEIVDPLGREGAALAVTSPAAMPDPRVQTEAGAGEPPKSEETVDLSGLRFRTEIIFDPETSELLAQRVVLLAADDELVGGWLEREGAPQTIFYRAFQPVASVPRGGLRPDGTTVNDGEDTAP